MNPEAMKDKSNKFEFKDTVVQSYPLIALMIKILFFSFIIFLIYKAFKSFKVYSLPKVEGVEEEREKIVKEEIKKNYALKIKSFIKNLISPKEPRAKVLHYFKKIQLYGVGKEVYRPYMTASQFMKILKAKGNVEQLDAKAISNIYNKAKFSSHEINEDQSSMLEQGYKDIKKSYRDE